MNRSEFLYELDRALDFLTDEDRMEAIQYYEELLDDAGAGGEQEVLGRLDSPQRIAQDIRLEYLQSGKKAPTGGDLAVPGSEPEEDSSSGGKSQARAKPETDWSRWTRGPKGPGPGARRSEAGGGDRGYRSPYEDASGQARESARSGSPYESNDANYREKGEKMPSWLIALLVIGFVLICVPVIGGIAIALAAILLALIVVGIALIGVAVFLLCYGIWAMFTGADLLLMLGVSFILLGLGVPAIWAGVGVCRTGFRQLKKGAQWLWNWVNGRVPGHG